MKCSEVEKNPVNVGVILELFIINGNGWKALYYILQKFHELQQIQKHLIV